MRKLLLKLAALLVPFFTTIAIINYLGDPALLFHQGYEAKMAEALLAGKNVKTIANSNDRKLQMELIRKEKTVPDIIVLGGSKALLISEESLKDIFGEGTCFNHSMSQATLFDYIGVIDCYKRKGQLPKNLMLSVDPYLLSPIYENEMHKPFVEDGKKIEWYENKNLLELLSFSYFQNSLKAIFSGVDVEKPEVTSETSCKNRIIKFPNGRRAYSKDVLNVSLEKSNTLAIQAAEDVVKKSGSLRKLDETKIQKFEAFINYLVTKKVKVAFFMPPYHPLYAKKIDGTDVSDIAHRSDKWFTSYAKKHAIKVYGSYDPKFSNCKEKDFFDAGHLRENQVSKALKIR